MSKRYVYLCYENYAEPLKEDRPEVVAVKSSEQEAVDFVQFYPGHLWVEQWELGTSSKWQAQEDRIRRRNGVSGRGM